MPRITINEQYAKTDTTLKLQNGSIVVLYDKMNAPIRTYIVTSFRSSTDKYRKNTAQYCSLIDLATGYPAFEEPSSRNTDWSRLMKHIYNGEISHQDCKPTQFTHTIKVLNKDSYSIDISY